jgi:hypothetical protein
MELIMNKPYIKSIVSYSMVGSLGFTILASLQGCGGDEPAPPPQQNQTKQGTVSDAMNKQQGVFMVIQQTGKNPDTYEVKEQYPSAEGTRAILKDMDGKERILTEAELKQIAEAEAKKVEDGTSRLAQSQPVAQNQGLSLGETLLASAAGALVGGVIANKLMGNSNFQRQQQYYQQRYPSSISRPIGGSMDTRGVNQTRPSTPTQAQPRSGFFGSGSAANPSNRSGSSAFGSSGGSSSSPSFGG